MSTNNTPEQVLSEHAQLTQEIESQKAIDHLSAEYEAWKILLEREREALFVSKFGGLKVATG